MDRELKIDIDSIGKGKTSLDIAESCAEPFNKCIYWITNLANTYIQNQIEKKIPVDEDISGALDRFKLVLKSLANTSPFIMVSKCYPKVNAALKHITEKNADYFLERDYSALIKEDGNKTLIYGLIKVVKSFFKELKPRTQSNIWEVANIMLVCCLKFEDHIKKTGIKYD